MTIPLAIYDGERTYLFRHPAPPDGFKPLSGDPGARALDGRHPSVTANTSAEMGGTMTATLILDDADRSRDLAALAAVAIHEAFHVYQREHHPDWQANEADLFVYPTDDSETLALRRLETGALRRALAATQPSVAECWGRRAIAVRADRFDRMDSSFAAYERGTELNEGLATYVQIRAGGRDTVELPAGGFEATAVRHRAYSAGAALALLLDRFDPGWAASFEVANGRSLDETLAAELALGRRDADEICGIPDGEEAEARRVARHDVAALVAARDERREDFDALPGWRIVVKAEAGAPLWPQGFDPLNVERVRGGVLHTRFVSLGNDSGQIEALDSSGVDVAVLTEAIGPHPLFNGIARVVIAVPGRPEFSIDGQEVTVRSSGVSGSFHNARAETTGARVVVTLGSRE